MVLSPECGLVNKRIGRMIVVEVRVYKSRCDLVRNDGM